MSRSPDPPVEIRALVERLERLDVRLWVEGDRLRVSAPRGTLDGPSRDALVAHKPALLEWLRERGSARLPALAPVPRDPPPPLSWAQERLWSLASLGGSSNAHNIAPAFHIDGPLDVRALAEAVRELQWRHEALRTRVVSVGGAPRQRVDPAPIPLDVTDVVGTDAEERANEAHRQAAAFAARPFAVHGGALFRARLLRAAADDHVLVFAAHHLVFDGTSRGLLSRELEALYAASSRGEAPALPALPVQYADYAVWQRRALAARADAQLERWREALSGAETLRLPYDRERPPTRQSGPAHVVRYTLPSALSAELAALGRRATATTYHVLLAGFHAALARTTGQRDHALCSPVVGRGRPELAGLIGYFNNLVVQRAEVDPALGFGALLDRVKAAALHAQANADVPFQRVAELRCVARTPLTRALFSLRLEPDDRLALPGLTARPLGLRKPTADFDLALYVDVRGDGIDGVLEADAHLFDEGTARALLEGWERMLRFAVASPERPIREAPWLGVDPRRVEALLERDPQVERATVRQLGGDRVAFVVPNQRDVPRPEALRARLAEALPAHALPAAFVSLDAVREPTERELASIHAAWAGRARPHLAPRTELEATLAEAWAKVLWLDRPIGVDEDFFDLGGHSLAAVELVRAVEAALGRPLPASALRRLTTVGDMARLVERGADGADRPTSSLPPAIHRALMAHTAAWEGERAHDASLLFGRHTAGSRPPLFWCFQGSHELSALAAALGPDQPLFGMRSGHLLMDKTPANIGALAAHYADEILAIQPRGPFSIGGNCQSGSVAFDIAKRLMGAGHHVALLAMVDRFVPERFDAPVALFFGDVGEFSPYRRFRAPLLGWRKLYRGGLTVDRLPSRHGSYFRRPAVEALAAKLRRAMDDALGGAVAGPAPLSSAQVLDDAAYRARLRAAADRIVVDADADLEVTVRIENASEREWRPTPESGIVLGARWDDAKGRTVRFRDGASELSEALAPASTVTLPLRLTAPSRRGRYTLTVDLIDEGIAWFGERGSTPATVPVRVE